METRGIECDIITYNTILNVHIKLDSEVEIVESFVAKLKEEGFNPNEVTYGILIHMYSKHNRPTEVLTLVQEMRENGISLNDVIYGTLIKMYAKLKQPNEILKLVEEMKSNGI